MTGQALQHLHMKKCTFEVDMEAFARMRSLTSPALYNASFTTILAARRVFQGRSSLEGGLLKPLACSKTARLSVEAHLCSKLTVSTPLYALRPGYCEECDAHAACRLG